MDKWIMTPEDERAFAAVLDMAIKRIMKEKTLKTSDKDPFTPKAKSNQNLQENNQ